MVLLLAPCSCWRKARDVKWIISGSDKERKAEAAKHRVTDVWWLGFGKGRPERSWLTGLSPIPAEMQAGGRTPCAFSILYVGVKQAKSNITAIGWLDLEGILHTISFQPPAMCECQSGCLKPLAVRYLSTWFKPTGDLRWAWSVAWEASVCILGLL